MSFCKSQIRPQTLKHLLTPAALCAGVDSDNGNVTADTQLMLDTVGKHPVRLIRSSKLNSKYKPVKGFRYDGLYDVTGYEMLDPPNSLRQRYRFTLERRRDQDPIRGGSGPERRPTTQEDAEYDKHRKLSGKTKTAD